MIEFLRQYKIGQFAIFDFALSYITFYFLAPYITRFFLQYRIHITRANILWLVLPLSVLVHVLVSKNTPFTRMILDPTGHYIEKIILAGMIYLSFRGVIW